MKKTYLTPLSEELFINLEVDLVYSEQSLGNASGEDLDDPIEDDPWS